MHSFIYTALPARVVFGPGTLAQVPDEVRRLGCRRALVLSTPQQVNEAQALADTLGDIGAGVFGEAAMHTPTEITERAVAAVKDADIDCLVALGGGSTIGLGKAIALRTGLPQVVIPTTYAGSEATPILGETRDGLKTTQRTLDVLPEVIVYDVNLTLSLPPQMSATSGINAMAHAVEALYAQDANPIISCLAEQGIEALARSLPIIMQDHGNREARSDALFGAWACGTCLGNVGMALHHKLCHILGGSLGLPHAETHTIILPHAVAYNAVAAPEAMTRVAYAIGASDAAQGLFDLAVALGVSMSLEDLGMQEAGLDRAAELAVASPYWNPRTIDHAGIRRLLDDAFRCRRPASARAHAS
jgi:alcohol dehydrogenase class IV